MSRNPIIMFMYIIASVLKLVWHFNSVLFKECFPHSLNSMFSFTLYYLWFLSHLFFFTGKVLIEWHHWFSGGILFGKKLCVWSTSAYSTSFGPVQTFLEFKKSAGKLFFPSNNSKMMTPSTSPHNLGLIYMTVFTSFLLISPSTQSMSQTIKIGSDGGYTDIVIQINDEVPEDHCPEILQNLKVSFFHRTENNF